MRRGIGMEKGRGGSGGGRTGWGNGRRDIKDVGPQSNRIGGPRDFLKEANGEREALVIVRFV